MRTTLTLDDDVGAALKAEMQRTGGTLKETVNELLRTALTARENEAPREPFQVSVRDMGRFEGLDYDNIGELLEQVEGPVHR